MDTLSRMSDAKYRALTADERAMIRCFMAFELLPLAAIEDMRSLSIMGQSLARQIVDEGTVSDSATSSAQRMVGFYERGSRVGFTACWAEGPDGAHCRKPKGHEPESEHAYF